MKYLIALIRPHSRSLIAAMIVVVASAASAHQARAADGGSSPACLRLKVIMIRPSDVPSAYSKVQTWVYGRFHPQLHIGERTCNTDKSLTASTWRQAFMETLTRTVTVKGHTATIGFTLCAWTFTDLASASTQYGAYVAYVNQSIHDGYKTLATPRIGDETIGTTVVGAGGAVYHAVTFRSDRTVVYLDYYGDPAIKPAKVIQLARSTGDAVRILITGQSSAAPGALAQREQSRVCS